MAKMKHAAVPPEVIELLTLHRQSFYDAAKIAETTAHPVPTDTRSWSQILVSLLTGIKGMARKNGADLADGSDVKAANLWLAIDTPRFNGCVKSGRRETREAWRASTGCRTCSLSCGTPSQKSIATAAAFGRCVPVKMRCFGRYASDGTISAMAGSFAATIFNSTRRGTRTRMCSANGAEI
jgi:hypothetical protein